MLELWREIYYTSLVVEMEGELDGSEFMEI